MNKSKSQRIGDEAEVIMKGLLPTSWIVNPQTKDYGKDYYVEVCTAAGDLTGESFIIQLKGHERAVVKRALGHVTTPLKLKSAVYYLDKVTDLPIFIIVVDTTTKQGWWAFLQPLLRTDQSWRQRTKVTIRVPIENSLADTRKFESAIRDAKRRLRIMHGSITEGLEAEKDRIAALEPRMQVVGLSSVSGIPILELSALEPFDITMTVNAQKANDAFGKGIPVVFEPGEISVQGTALFDRISTGGGILHAQRRIQGSIWLISCDPDNQELARLEVPGIFESGLSEGRFHGSLSSSVFSITFDPFWCRERKPHKSTANWNVNLSKWNGQELRRLAWFDQISRFIQSLTTCHMLNIQVQIDGNAEAPIGVTPPPREKLIHTCAFLKCVEQARKLCTHFDLNPQWDYRSFDVTHITELFDLVFHLRHEVMIPKCRISFTLEKLPNADLLKRMKTPSELMVTGNDVPYRILSETIHIARMERVLSHMALTSISGNKLEFTGTHESIMVLRVAGTATPLTTSVAETPE